MNSRDEPWWARSGRGRWDQRPPPPSNSGQPYRRASDDGRASGEPRPSPEGRPSLDSRPLRGDDHTWRGDDVRERLTERQSHRSEDRTAHSKRDLAEQQAARRRVVDTSPPLLPSRSTNHAFAESRRSFGSAAERSNGPRRSTATIVPRRAHDDRRMDSNAGVFRGLSSAAWNATPGRGRGTAPARCDHPEWRPHSIRAHTDGAALTRKVSDFLLPGAGDSPSGSDDNFLIRNDQRLPSPPKAKSKIPRKRKPVATESLSSEPNSQSFEGVARLGPGLVSEPDISPADMDPDFRSDGPFGTPSPSLRDEHSPRTKNSPGRSPESSSAAVVTSPVAPRQPRTTESLTRPASLRDTRMQGPESTPEHDRHSHMKDQRELFVVADRRSVDQDAPVEGRSPRDQESPIDRGLFMDEERELPVDENPETPMDVEHDSSMHGAQSLFDSSEMKEGPSESSAGGGMDSIGTLRSSALNLLFSTEQSSSESSASDASEPAPMPPINSDPLIKAAVERCSFWLPYMLTQTPAALSDLLQKLKVQYGANSKGGAGSGKSKDVLKRADELLSQALSRFRHSSLADEPMSSVAVSLADAWLEGSLSVGDQQRLHLKEETHDMTIELPCGMVTTFNPNVFRRSHQPETEEVPEQIPVIDFLSEMGEAITGAYPGEWELNVDDDLINPHEIFPVFEYSPDDIIFSGISHNLARHFLRNDRSADCRALRDRLRVAHRSWLEYTNTDMDVLDFKLRFGCLPFRATLNKDAITVGPSGQWPWRMPGTQYTSNRGTIDSMLLESQWFSLGVKTPVYRQVHKQPFVVNRWPPARVYPAAVPESMSRYDLLNGTLTNSGFRSKLQTKRSGDLTDDVYGTESPPTALGLDVPPEYQKLPSVVGPGTSWQKSALVESGVERLIDKWYLNEDSGSWDRNRLSIDGSIKKRFHGGEEEVVNDSTVWSARELIAFASHIYKNSYDPRKILPVLASCGDPWPSRAKTQQQCTLLYSLLKSWIFSSEAKVDGEFSSHRFNDLYIDPLVQFINRHCETHVGYIKAESASYAQIAAFKESGADDSRTVLPASPQVNDEELLELAETGSATRELIKSVISAGSSVILSPEVQTVLCQSGNELKILERTTELPIKQSRMVQHIIHQITKPMFLDEELKARLATHTLQNEQFMSDLTTHMARSAVDDRTDNLIKLFVTQNYIPGLSSEGNSASKAPVVPVNFTTPGEEFRWTGGTAPTVLSQPQVRASSRRASPGVQRSAYVTTSPLLASIRPRPASVRDMRGGALLQPGRPVVAGSGPRIVSADSQEAGGAAVPAPAPPRFGPPVGFVPPTGFLPPTPVGFLPRAFQPQPPPPPAGFAVRGDSPQLTGYRLPSFKEMIAQTNVPPTGAVAKTTPASPKSPATAGAKTASASPKSHAPAEP